jgi:tRNA (guanine6-N2)-methyltransferase
MKLKSYYEANVPEGLEALAWDEISGRFGERVKLLHSLGERPGLLQFTYGEAQQRLLGLKSVLSLFWARRFDVPRPRALLGHEYFTELMEGITAVLKLSPPGTFKTIYLAAAGSDSAVMSRLVEEIAAKTRLRVVRDEGDLLVRVRRPLDGAEQWEVLVRLAQRPLSVRRWRVCDFEGALNAAVAYVLASLTQPGPEDVFLNLGCGSGSILIERAGLGPAGLLLGCDTNPDALACAHANLEAAGFLERVQLAPWDAASLPLPAGSVDVLCSDLPFGHDVGSHEENLLLYPCLLKEAARVARPGARAVFLTHEIRLMETVLNLASEWEVKNILPIAITGLHPRIYVLKRTAEA